MEQPLTPQEYQHWKDTAIADGDIIDRFAATIDNLFAVNAKLLEALGSMPANPRSLAEANDIIYNAKLRGAAAIKEARK
jgi:hypothetical protein